MESSEEAGSLNDIKRVVPKSKVSFKMFYGKEKTIKMKTKHRTDVPEVLPNNQEQSEVSHQTVLHDYAPPPHHEILVQPNNYLMANNQDKPTVHYKTELRGKFQSYAPKIHQSDQKEPTNHFESNDFQNYFKESNQEKFVDGTGQLATGHQAFKLILPTSNLNVNAVQQNYQLQKQPITLEQTNQLETSRPTKAPDHFSSPVYVIDSHPSAYNHQTEVYESSTQAEISKEQPKLQNHKINFMEKHSKPQYLNFGNEKTKLYNQKNRGGKVFQSSGDVLKQQDYYSINTEEHPSQQVVIYPTIQPQMKFQMKETTDSTDVPKTILTQNLPPLKSEDYIDKYHRDVAQIQNSWKSFNRMKPNEYQSSQNELQLVTKPADSFHFEINPFIDVGDGGQENFDHQKALEGSTSFNINHAIENGNEPFHKVSNLVTSVPEVQPTGNPVDHQANHFYKQTLLYAFPPLMPSLPAVIDHTFKDSVTSNSDFVHPTSTSNVETNEKYVFQPQFISIFPNDYFKLGNSNTENGIHQSLLRLHLPIGDIFQQQKNERPKGGLIPSFLKPKNQIKQVRENWLKFNQDQNFQQTKKNPHYVLNSRPSQKFLNTISDDWNLQKTKTKTGNSNKAVIQPETVPYNQDFGRKIISPKANKALNRDREGKGMPERDGQLNVNLGKDNFRLDVIKGNNQKFIKRGANNEFSVSASYKIDKPFESRNLN